MQRLLQLQLLLLLQLLLMHLLLNLLLLLQGPHVRTDLLLIGLLSHQLHVLLLLLL